MRFTPGPGVGGHRLPIDPSYLSWRVRRSLGESFRFVELANDINEHMPAYVVSRLLVALNRRSLAVRGRRILLIECGQAQPERHGCWVLRPWAAALLSSTLLQHFRPLWMSEVDLICCGLCE